MKFESKCRRRTRGWIEDLIYEMKRIPTYEEVRTEFKKRGFPRPFRKVVENVLEEKERGAVSQGALANTSWGEGELRLSPSEID
jgi:hypothetical protein